MRKCDVPAVDADSVISVESGDQGGVVVAVRRGCTTLRWLGDETQMEQLLRALLDAHAAMEPVQRDEGETPTVREATDMKRGDVVRFTDGRAGIVLSPPVEPEAVTCGAVGELRDGIWAALGSRPEKGREFMVVECARVKGHSGKHLGHDGEPIAWDDPAPVASGLLDAVVANVDMLWKQRQMKHIAIGDMVIAKGVTLRNGSAGLVWVGLDAYGAPAGEVLISRENLVYPERDDKADAGPAAGILDRPGEEVSVRPGVFKDLREGNAQIEVVGWDGMKRIIWLPQEALKLAPNPVAEPETDQFPEAWRDLLVALPLLAKGRTDDVSPFICTYDTLWVTSDPSRYSAEELAELDRLGFDVDSGTDSFRSFRFGSA
jgi:hypothetical protein